MKNRTYTGGKHSKQNLTPNKEAMFQLIRKCAKANKEAVGKHTYDSVLKQYFISP